MMQTRSGRISLALAVTVLAASACGYSVAILTPEAVSGSWRQISYNGDPFPVTVGVGMNERQFLNRTITLTESGSFRDSLTEIHQTPVGPEQGVLVLAGVYHLGRRSIVFDYLDAVDTSGRVNGDRLVIDFNHPSEGHLVSVLIHDDCCTR